MMINKHNFVGSGILFLVGVGILAPNCANALGQQVGNFDFRLTGYGTAGVIEPNFEKTKFLGDFKVRAQATYDVQREHKFGVSYVYDETALDEKEWAHDIFGFWQWQRVGRVEVGLTDSVAHKLGLGLPDVGGLRVNENSWIYKKLGADGLVITSTGITAGHEALRLNVVSASNSHAQYGVSVSGFAEDYNFGASAGLKLKYSEGKTKFAVSVGADFMDNPEGFQTHDMALPVYADWRAQFAIGTNVQYNSFVLGLTARAIYDENPLGLASDGFVTGVGASYDILKYSLSVSYLVSDTGVWHSDMPEYVDNTVVGSVRCKYNKYIDFWASLGVTRHDPFAAAAVRLTF